MKRFTTDTPTGNVQGFLNFAFIRNAEVYLRGIGDGGEDISLADYCKKECKERCDNDLSDVPAEEFAELMDCECPMAVLYALGVAAAELRSRLSEYEDAGLEPEEIKKALGGRDGHKLDSKTA
jgi:hypothetical protein